MKSMLVLSTRLGGQIESQIASGLSLHLLHFPQLWESLRPERLHLLFPVFSDLGHNHTTDATDLWEQSLVQFSLTGLLFSYSQLTNWFKSCALEALGLIKVLYRDHQISWERTQRAHLEGK